MCPSACIFRPVVLGSRLGITLTLPVYWRVHTNSLYDRLVASKRAFFSRSTFATGYIPSSMYSNERWLPPSIMSQSIGRSPSLSHSHFMDSAGTTHPRFPRLHSCYHCATYSTTYSRCRILSQKNPFLFGYLLHLMMIVKQNSWCRNVYAGRKIKHFHHGGVGV